MGQIIQQIVRKNFSVNLDDKYISAEEKIENLLEEDPVGVRYMFRISLIGASIKGEKN